ncbi:MAG: alanine racemase [bacterium]|nr:alanine racemase [bacterium]
MDERKHAWAEIDLSALENNYRWIRDRADNRRIIAVVKANAYGHGAVPVARALSGAGCDAFAVVTLGEARELRAAGILQPILLLEGTLRSDEADEAIATNLVPVISRIEALDSLDAAANRVGRPVPFHLKLDTGMGRLGLSPRQLGAFLERLAGSSRLRLQGVMSHLAEADDPDSPATQEQRRVFGELVGQVRSSGHSPEWIHIDNSAGVVRGAAPETTAVRPGLLLYGADPTLEGGNALEPVMSFCARVCHSKSVPPGAKIGYGGVFMSPRGTCILTAAVGYADGLPRAAGGRYEVGYRGTRIPIVGRVSCDFTTLDAGPLEAGGVDESVLLFGRRDGLEIPVEELATAVDTIAYEILVRIGARVPRIPV